MAIVSKALIAAAYRRKLVELQRLGVEVTAIVPPGWREGETMQALEPANEEDCSIVVTPVRWNGHFHVHYYPDLPRVLRAIGPDILHVDEEPYNLATYLAVRAASQGGIPSLFFSWQNQLRRYPPPFSYFERSVFRSVRHAIAGTEEAASVLHRKGYLGAVSVVPQFGVDPSVFHPAVRPDAPFTVGFLNRLVLSKGPLIALDAFAALPSDSRLLVVGDGPLRGAIEAEAQRRSLDGRVTILERVASVDVPELLHRLDAVVLPSLTTPSWKEQFGRILIEGMAAGLAVVGSDSGEIPRVIGDAGIIVPEGNSLALAEALLRLHDDVGLRRELGHRGRQRVLERFTHQRIAERTYAAYSAVLGRA